MENIFILVWLLQVATRLLKMHFLNETVIFTQHLLDDFGKNCVMPVAGRIWKMQKYIKIALCNCFLQPMLWQEKLWQPKWNTFRPCYHWQVRKATLPLILAVPTKNKPLSFARCSIFGSLAVSSFCSLHHLLSSCVIMHRWVDLETWWRTLWGFSNCLRVVKGSSFICHCSHCEEHFMPREFFL